MNSKFLLTTIIGTALATPAFAKDAANIPPPAEIYRPASAQTIKAKLFTDGEFEATYQITRYPVRVLAQMVKNHALGQGFRITQNEISNDAAELEFTKQDKTLEVSITKKSDGTLKYQVDLENN